MPLSPQFYNNLRDNNLCLPRDTTLLFLLFFQPSPLFPREKSFSLQMNYNETMTLNTNFQGIFFCH